MSHTNLSSNIWKYTFLQIANKRIFAAILGVYYLSIPNVTAETIGLILLISSIAGFVFEIPSGYLSDKIGHKTALVISRAMMLVSTVFLLFATNTLLLILGAVCMTIAQAFKSGTDSAFMHETLRALGREDDYATVTGKASSIGFAVPIVLMVLTPFLVEISFQTPFVIALIIDLAGLFIAFTLITPPVTPEHIKEIGVTNFRQVLQTGYQLGFFRYALFSGVVEGVLFGVMIFRAPYQAFLTVPVIYFGVLFGLGRVVASLLLAYSGRLKSYFGTITAFYRFQLVFYVPLLILLGSTTNVTVVLGLFILLNGFQWGLTQTERGFLLATIRDSKFKATLLSTKAQLGLLVKAVTTYGLGLMIVTWGYQLSFLCVSIISLLVLLPLYWYLHQTRY